MDRTVKIWKAPELMRAPAEPTIQSGAGGGGPRAACIVESEKLCPGEERVGRCLRAHIDLLSAECKAALGRGQRGIN